MAEILFEGRAVNFQVKFTACGDGLELVELAGVTKGYCYKCEIQMADSKFERGRQFSRQPNFLNSEVHKHVKPQLRTLRRANEFSKKFSDSDTKNIAKRRNENFQYERPSIYQYHRSIEESEDPEFHSASNIATRRIYLRGLLQAHGCPPSRKFCSIRKSKIGF